VRPAGPRGGRTPARPRPRQAALTVAALRLAGRLSLRGLQRLGGAVGWLLGVLPTRPRANTLECLRLAFPDLSDRQRRRLARRSLVEDARMLLEHAAFWTWEPERALALVRVVEGEETLATALAEGRGVILAGLHLGAIEALNAHCAARHGLVGQYRAPRVAELDPFLRQARERYGARLLPTGTSSVRGLVQGLREGRLLGIACDQDPGEGQGVFVPYFSVPTNTTTLVGRLASRTGAEVVLGWAERLGDAAGFGVHFVPAPPEVASDDLLTSASALNRAVEACVRRHPEQALWSYRRFRIRPPAAEAEGPGGSPA
jgi:KDO2-lipid IV(A) lauroyltransferase